MKNIRALKWRTSEKTIKVCVLGCLIIKVVLQKILLWLNPSLISSQNEDVPAIPVSGEMSPPGVAFLRTQFKEAPSKSSPSQYPVSFSSEWAVPTERDLVCYVYCVSPKLDYKLREGRALPCLPNFFYPHDLEHCLIYIRFNKCWLNSANEKLIWETLPHT